MADTSTIARPYAKAVFDYALAKEQLTFWSQTLQALSTAILEPSVGDFLNNPLSTIEQQAELLLSVMTLAKHSTAEKDGVQNFLLQLAQNKRLMVIPDIYVQYEALRAAHEKTLVVDVKSFSQLNEAQKNNLASSLSERLKRQVTLNVTLDQTLLGGAIIYAGDLVIDGSILGKLKKLGTDLAA